jgi:hypothetical protein
MVIHRAKKRLTEDGLPINPLDWKEADWADLHYAIERAKKLISSRHATESAEPKPEGDKK